MTDLDLKYNSEPVCPHCGEVADGDASELDFDGNMEGECQIDCGNCDKPLSVYREVTVTYSTSEA